MARKQRSRLKEILFFTFLGLSLVLVLLVWADGLRADADAVPGYYRSSTPIEADVTPTGPATTAPAAGAGATEEAPGEHPGSHREPTTTPTGRNLNAEEM